MRNPESGTPQTPGPGPHLSPRRSADRTSHMDTNTNTQTIPRLHTSPDQHPARIRTAVYVDFDNVFSGLWAVDHDAAMSFATRPLEWLERLSTYGLDGERRDYRVRKAYLNPHGSLPGDGPDAKRLYFQKFRPALTAAGFEVVDCPALTSSHKNAADIRIVLDVADDATSPHLDEYVVASSDADFTPLMYRLRAADRRTVILSTNRASDAFRNTADQVIDNGTMLNLINGTDPTDRKARHPQQEPAAGADVTADVSASAAAPEGDTSHAAVPEPLSDEHRSADPRPARFPDTVARMCATTSLPQLPTESWPKVIEAVIEYAASTADFQPNQASVPVRDRLATQGVAASRAAVNAVARTLVAAGVDLGPNTAPSVRDCVAALVELHMARAAGTGWEVTHNERKVISQWLLGKGARNDALPAASAPGDDASTTPAKDTEFAADITSSEIDGDTAPEAADDLVEAVIQFLINQTTPHSDTPNPAQAPDPQSGATGNE